MTVRCPPLGLISRRTTWRTRWRESGTGVFRRERVHVVVLPHVVDAKVAGRVTLVAEAHLLDDPYRTNVARHHCGLDAMEARPPEREPDGQLHRFGRVTPASLLLADPVTDRGVLPRSANDVAERDAADQGTGPELEDPEGVSPVVEPLLHGSPDLELLALVGKELLRLTRVVRSEEVPVLDADGDLRRDVIQVQRPDRNELAGEGSSGY